VISWFQRFAFTFNLYRYIPGVKLDDREGGALWKLYSPEAGLYKLNPVVIHSMKAPAFNFFFFFFKWVNLCSLRRGAQEGDDARGGGQGGTIQVAE
jgi:hypothetical protein